MKGTIKNVKENGFGFISPEDGSKDVFFHATDCLDGDFKEMTAGQTVEFDMGNSDRGPIAKNVILA